MTFEDDVNAGAVADRPTKDVQVIMFGKLRTFRFTQIDGIDWGSLVAVNPLRLGSPIDQNYGYNYDGVVMGAAALNGVIVNDDDTLEEISAETWPKIWKQLTGNGYKSLGDAVWSLNEWEPQMAVVEAKKALLPKSKAKRV